MKKILLAAVALLCVVGVSAQDFNLRATSAMKSMPVSTPPSKLISTRGTDALSVAKKAPKPILKASEMPEGEQREYFIERFDYVGGLSDETKYLYDRVTKETVVFGTNGTVYIPNILAGSYIDEPGWIEGKLSSDGTIITIEQDQLLGTYQGMDCTLSAFDEQGYTVTGPISFYFDSEYGVAMMEGGLMMLVTYMGQTGFLTQCSSIYMYPADNQALLAEPVTRNVTAMETTQAGTESVTYTVEDINSDVLGLRFIKGLMPAYPDSWFVAYHDEQSNDLIYAGNVIDNDVMSVVMNEQNVNSDPSVIASTQTVFTYNADGSYTLAQGDFISDYVAMSYDQLTQKYEYGSSCMLSNITLGAPTPSGISSITTDNEPVATEYYDLSGRRVDAATKGVTIRVEKYADGTSKSVKTIK